MLNVRKRFTSVAGVILVSVLVFSSTAFAASGAPNAGVVLNGTAPGISNGLDNKFNIDVKDLKVDSTNMGTKTGNKVYFQAKPKSGTGSKLVTPMHVGENHQPVAELACITLAGESASGLYTQNTIIGCLWAYFDGSTLVNLCSDPDGDQIMQYEFSGLPDGSYMGTVTSNGVVVGIAVQLAQPGSYTLNFRCEDQHGLWSANFRQPLSIYNINNEPEDVTITQIGSQGLRNYGMGWHYMVRSDAAGILTEFSGLVTDSSSAPSANFPITIYIKRDGSYYWMATGSTNSSGMFYISSYTYVPLYSPSLSAPDENLYRYLYVVADVEVWCGDKLLGQTPFYILVV